VECIHIERQIVKLSFVICDRAVCVAIEFHDGIDEVPYLLVACMENVGAVFMDVDPFDVFAIDIAAKLCTFVYDEAFLARFLSSVCKSGTEKSGTDNEVIEIGHCFTLCSNFFAIKISEECLWSLYYSLEKIIDFIFLG